MTKIRPVTERLGVAGMTSNNTIHVCNVDSTKYKFQRPYAFILLINCDTKKTSCPKKNSVYNV